MTRRILTTSRALFVLVALLCATPGLGRLHASTASSQQSDTPHTLAPDVLVEHKLAGGQMHAWQVPLTAGDYLRLWIETKHPKVTSALFAPGQSSRSGDAPLLSVLDGNVLVYHRVSVFSFIAEASGDYRLEVSAPTGEAAIKRYEIQIQIKEQRPATPRDRVRVEAEGADLDGRRVRESATLEERRRAIASYERSLALWRELGDRRKELELSQRLSNQHRQLGELPIAFTYASEGLHIARALGDRYLEANLFMALGGVHKDNGNYQEALDSYSRAREIFAASSSDFGEALAIEDIGLMHLLLGDPQSALGYFTQTVPTFSRLGIKSHEAAALNNLGVAHSELGALQRALEFHQRALPLARESGFALAVPLTLGYLGDAYLALGDEQKAAACYTEKLRACRTLGDALCVAHTLKALGDAALSAGETARALNLLRESLEQSRRNGQRRLEADALYSVARAHYSLGRLEEARQEIELSLDITEHLRAGLAAADFRATFFTSAQRGFDLYIDLLMSRHAQAPAAGFDALALRASERARARSLLERLAEHNADIRQGADPRLLERERDLRRQLNAKAAARAAALNRKGGEGLTTGFDKEIAELTSGYREVEARIRATSPRYAALTRPEPLAADEIQRRVLDSDTVLLEFSLGERRSWLWAVTPDAIVSRQLPPRSEVERMAREVYELLTARQPRAGEGEDARAARAGEADDRFHAVAAGLSRALLGPVAARLRREWRGKRLLIVASGALEFLPFAALPLPSEESVYRPLIAEHEVVNLPSASVLSVIRREAAGRAAAPKAVAVLADPVFETSDPRLSAARSKSGRQEVAVRPRAAARARPPAPPAEADSPLSRSFRSMGRAALGRLPFSREEAEAIASFAPRAALLKATDFEASRAKALGGELSQYRIVHFATHGLLNSEHPELSGLVLSLVDEDGRAQDGFLRMHEIYNLRLPAETVVLSACQTGLGKEIRGEGLVGLTRGFMYAGAQRVVASLWQVDDLATAELMKRFYRGMLKEGLRPAAALRAAQLDMMKQRRRSSPYFWAGFVMQGEYK